MAYQADKPPRNPMGWNMRPIRRSPEPRRDDAIQVGTYVHGIEVGLLCWLPLDTIDGTVGVGWMGSDMRRAWRPPVSLSCLSVCLSLSPLSWLAAVVGPRMDGWRMRAPCLLLLLLLPSPSPARGDAGRMGMAHGDAAAGQWTGEAGHPWTRHSRLLLGYKSGRAAWSSGGLGCGRLSQDWP